jgi:SAM-dependent methyltransferase
MSGYREETYGERIASIYDEWYASFEEAAVTTLSQLAGNGRALELGIGTGRLALPIRAKGVAIEGIDASPAMVAKLQAKQDGAEIPVTLGNFADVAVAGRFSLIFVAFNTFFALLTQEEQVRCFQNVAAHLDEGGVFVVEAFIPDLARYSNGRQTFRTIRVGDDEVHLDATLLDPVNQRLASQHIVLSEQGTRLYPVRLRYAWPAELDLIARLAGLQLRQRWGDWTQGPLTADSGRHVSVYERPAVVG